MIPFNLTLIPIVRFALEAHPYTYHCTFYLPTHHSCTPNLPRVFVNMITELPHRLEELNQTALIKEIAFPLPISSSTTLQSIESPTGPNDFVTTVYSNHTSATSPSDLFSTLCACYMFGQVWKLTLSPIAISMLLYCVCIRPHLGWVLS